MSYFSEIKIIIIILLHTHIYIYFVLILRYGRAMRGFFPLILLILYIPKFFPKSGDFFQKMMGGCYVVANLPRASHAKKQFLPSIIIISYVSSN